MREYEQTMWISEAEAQRLTGKSHSTIRRWLRANESNRTHVNEDGKISMESLRSDYNFIERVQTHEDERKSKSNEIEGMSLANTQTSLQAFSEQMHANERTIERQQKTIDSLINRKSRLPLWITVGFLFAILAIVGAFRAYTNQMSDIHEKALAGQSKAFIREINAQGSQIEGLKDLINAKDNIETTQSDQIKNLTKEVRELKSQILNSKKMPRYNVSGSSTTLP